MLGDVMFNRLIFTPISGVLCTLAGSWLGSKRLDHTCYAGRERRTGKRRGQQPRATTMVMELPPSDLTGGLGC